MSQECIMKEVSIICKLNGEIEEIKGPRDFGDIIKKGNNLVDFIDSSSHEEYISFINTVKRNGYIMGTIFTIKVGNGLQSVCVNAYCLDEQLHVTVLGGCIETINILQEITRSNKNKVRVKNNTRENSDKLIEYIELLENWAMKDALTNVYNQRYFNKVIYDEIAKALKAKYSLSLTVIDIDVFKGIKDECTHRDGNELLLTFVAITKKIIRDEWDILFRLGGDEFLILSINQNQEKAYKTIENINRNLGYYSFGASLSYGVIEIIPEEMSKEINVINYLKEADNRKYQFKRNIQNIQLQCKLRRV